MLLARYNTDGSLDTSFGGGDGWQVTDFSNQDRGWDVKIQSNGKIVIAGVGDYGGDTDDGRYGIVGRFNPDGSSIRALAVTAKSSSTTAEQPTGTQR